MKSRSIALVFCALLAGGGARAAGTGIQMLNKDAVSQGSAKVGLAKGSVSLKVNLAPLPAQIDTGTELFDATIYKAYLVSTADPALEIPLGNLYPTALSKAALKAALKGDLTQMGFDKVVVVAFSKDGLHSFDVLTGTLVAP
jgi:hypothetical protein